MAITIYRVRKALSQIESQEGFIYLESLFEKDKYLISLLSATEAEISTIREEALNEINKAKTNSNLYERLSVEGIIIIDDFYPKLTLEKSEEFRLYKQIASICESLETFKSAVKVIIKANRVEIKNQLNF